MKKLLSILLAAIMVLSMVSAVAEEEITLTLWSIATESDSSCRVICSSAKAETRLSSIRAVSRTANSFFMGFSSF